MADRYEVDMRGCGSDESVRIRSQRTTAVEGGVEGERCEVSEDMEDAMGRTGITKRRWAISRAPARGTGQEQGVG